MWKSELKKATNFFVIIIFLHVLGILLLLPALYKGNSIIGMAIIAYSLGLRHAFDSDHIVAIDNTVRKLIEKGKNSQGVGFYFSLGHSTVVFAMIVLIALIGKTAKHGMESFSTIGGIIGTIVSSTFLIIIGLTNLLYLIKVLRSHEDKQPENLGFMYRFTQRLFTFIDSQKQLYIIGFLFGLGFDTASEIGLIALSTVTATSQSIPLVSIFAFPVLFAAGMSLMDTLDSTFMNTNYKWAMENSRIRNSYNVLITSISVITAFLIGGYQLLSLLIESYNLQGPFWNLIQVVNFDYLGICLVAFFIISLIVFVVWNRNAFKEPLTKSIEK
ncbi:DNA repair protein [Bacillus cereus]|uniref:HoxN/HupN/NixA family nickel/cobalt transporter n=1 Tax=Bacillus cereus TaxID=1396 RepID=UPI000BFD722E|nr:DNA repair protein [Bacillus cereus]MDA2528474.1 DNA repair protein [Bacillus cereus]PGW76729.1 DNA repair protein [Bacillus cereus]HDX9708387.1 DNA repair protein [Bacillus cereus]